MVTRTFDRETLLDLFVNAVPLFIMGFFVVAFVVFAPFGFDPLASLLQFALVIVPFVLLLVLTYFSAKVVVEAEENGPVFLPGQTTPAEAKPLEGHHGADEESDHVETPDEPEVPADESDDEPEPEPEEETADDADDESADGADDDTHSA